MKRLIDKALIEWKNSKNLKPLIIRGARQVGKTYAVRKLGKQFKHFVVVDFEFEKAFHSIFEENLDPKRIIQQINVIIGPSKQIIPGETLLFFDEVQLQPRALAALRYFYEKMPDLHVIAAGSLIEFALKNIGLPVGRVTFLHMYPMSFIEFLYASGHEAAVDMILTQDANTPISESIHERMLIWLGEYFAVGGMPEAVQAWTDTRDIYEAAKAHKDIITAYQQDFKKYTKKHQLKYIQKLFESTPRFMGQRFKFTQVGEGYRKRELDPCIELLKRADVIHAVNATAGQGIPLGAESALDIYKLIFVDIAIAQTLLGLNIGKWLLNPEFDVINKGAVAEAFVGQELLAYSDPSMQAKLYYWQRSVRGSSAEIDYLIQQEEKIVPIEVKSAKGGHLKSMQLFLSNHKQSPYGIRFSQHNYSVFEGLYSYPLYAVAGVTGLHRSL